MATNSSILAWEIPWIEKTESLQSMGSQKVGFDLVNKQTTKIAYTISLTYMIAVK